VDYEAYGPAVDSIFNNGSHTGVCDPDSYGCSFTDGAGGNGGPGPQHWSSTTVSPASNEARGSHNYAWIVSFGGGAAVAFYQKDRNLFHVRLVRGGCSNGTPLGID